MDYNTKIKDLVFRLLKEKYPTQFSKFYAEFGSLEITWVRDHIVYDHILLQMIRPMIIEKFLLQLEFDLKENPYIILSN